MSMFRCVRCDELRDSDEGCEEAPASKYGLSHQLLCAECAVEDEEETEACRAASIDPRDPDYSRPGIFAYHNCSGCNDGKMPCRNRHPHQCDWPRARND
jgi:hypothetical protein